MSIFRLTVVPALMLLFLSGCLDQMTLPPTVAGVGPQPDTTYLPLYPTWGEAEGLIEPVEVVVSHARQIFVADIGARDILVFNQAGVRVDLIDTTFRTLDFSHLGDNFSPLDIDIDKRLNIIMINGTNKIYRWNQYWNTHGIDSVISEFLIINSSTGERRFLTVEELENFEPLSSGEWDVNLDSSKYTYDAAMIDSLLRPHIYFDAEFWYNQQTDIYYSATETQFSAISNARLNGDYFFYAADSAQNRIMRAAMVRNGAVKLGNGETFFTHTALFVDNVKEIGTGAGSVNKPTGLDVDSFGNLYWSQFGKHVYVHSVLPSASLGFPSRFELFVDDIMTPDQYLGALDISVDAEQKIYVANSVKQEILVFNGDGSFFKKAGVDFITLDTTMWVMRGGEGTFLDTSLWIPSGTDSVLVDTALFIPALLDSVLIDTFYVHEIKGQLFEPVSVATDERGVIYVADRMLGGIYRFILSTSFDENLANFNQ